MPDIDANWDSVRSPNYTVHNALKASMVPHCTTSDADARQVPLPQRLAHLSAALSGSRRSGPESVEPYCVGCRLHDLDFPGNAPIDRLLVQRNEWDLLMNNTERVRNHVVARRRI